MKKFILPLMAATVLSSFPASAQTINTYDPFNSMWNQEKDINLSIEDGILTLSGTRQKEVEEQGKDYYVKEMSSGSFSRSVRLPKNIDESKIDAVFKNGILTITVPKTAAKEETSKKIKIKTE